MQGTSSSAFANIITALLIANGQGGGRDIRVYGPQSSSFLSLTLVSTGTIAFYAGTREELCRKM